MKINKYLIVLASFMSVFVACTEEKAPVEDVVSSTNVNTNDQIDNALEVDEQSGKMNFKADIVYFEFDQYSLTEEGKKSLEDVAKFLELNPNLKLKIEGHCDARGSTEYNLALGLNRAGAVKSYLENLGVVADRLTAVSYGEEKLAISGADESSHSKNRRAEFFVLTH